jgi:hypothetical protein
MRIGIISGEQQWARVLANQFIAKNREMVESFIVERSNSKKSQLKQLVRRFKKYGLFKTIDQILLQIYLYIVKPWSFVPESENVIEPIIVDCVNSEVVLNIVKERRIDLLVCIAPSILDEEIFSAPKLGAINLHPGINPRYRGAGGNFWALYEENLQYVGVTIHVIDGGIDTGKVLDRVFLSMDKNLNTFEKITYIALQTGLIRLTQLLRNSKIEYQNVSDEQSKLYGWYGLSQYLEVKKKLHQLLAGS